MADTQMEQDGAVSPINLFESQAVIKVIGVGGAGCNAINRMVGAGVEGVELIALNTDQQSLKAIGADIKLAIGSAGTRGLGSGGDALRGEAAVRESEKEIQELLAEADMVFVTAGMGGGTGTGGAPLVARMARSRGILTVGVITRPFTFEGSKRARIARDGAEQMHGAVDALITIPNDRLLQVVDRSVPFGDAMAVADEALMNGVKGITDIVVKPGLINVDFADVKTVMTNAGQALMGIGYGQGEKRARNAAEGAVKSPLMEASVQGAKKMLVNITHGASFGLHEADEVMNYLSMFCDPADDDIFMGLVLNEDMDESVQVTVVATGLSGEQKEWDSELFQAAGRDRRDASRVPAGDPESAARRRGVPAASQEGLSARKQAVLDIGEITDIALPAFLRSSAGA